MSLLLDSKSVTPSITGWSYDYVKYNSSRGWCYLFSDGLTGIHLVLEARIQALSTDGTERTVSRSTTVTVTLDDTEETFSVQSNHGDGFTVKSSTTYKSFANSSTVKTFTRTTTPQTITGTIRVINNGGGSRTDTFSFVIPPFKQNAVKDGRRITCTANGVEYDLLNYK